jgi:M6 family metalloprotease-like protein
MPLDPEIVERFIASGKPVPVDMTERRFMKRFGESSAAAVNRLPKNAVTRLAPRQENGNEGLLRPGGKSLNAGDVRPQGAQAGQMLKAIVILVKFQDDPPGGPTVRFSPGVWDSMLFGEFYFRGEPDTTTGRTLSRYLREISYGDVDIMTHDMPSVVGWVTAPNSYSYYCEDDEFHDNGFGPYPRNVQRLVIDAVTAADPYVDFAQYAVNGVVQNLFVVHAGSGAEWSGGPALIWSHSWAVGVEDGWGNETPQLVVDGVTVFGYSMEPEAGGDVLGEAGPATAPILPTVGVYAHEFGHVLGLPDEYDYGYESQGTGRVSLMASGSWNRCPNIHPYCAGNSPSHLSALQTAWLGFVTPIEVTATTFGLTIPPIATTPVGSMYKVAYPGTDGREYWLFENRQQIGFDEGFARMSDKAHGLCVYHVDENVFWRVGWLPNEAECVKDGVYAGYPRNCDCGALEPNWNNGEKWYGISVEQADGLYQLELGSSAGGWQDFYSSATGVSAFNAASRPNSSSYYTHYGCAGVPALLNMTEVGWNVTLDVVPRPLAEAVLEPQRINLKSQGSWVSLKLGFETPYEAADVDPSSVTLAGVPADPKFFEVGRNESGAATALLKFERSLIAEAIWEQMAERELAAATKPEGSAQETPEVASEAGTNVDLLLTGLVDEAYFERTVSANVTDLSGEPRLLAPEADVASGQSGIVWWLPRPGGVRIHVLTEAGKLVKVLADGFQSAGFHRGVWDGTDGTGAPVGSGRFVVRLDTRGGSALLTLSR